VSYPLLFTSAAADVHVSAAVQRDDRIMLAVGSNRNIQNVRCDAVTGCAAVDWGVLVFDELHSLQLQLDSSDAPVIVYATTRNEDGEHDDDDVEDEVYSIGLIRDVVHSIIFFGQGDLNSLSFVLDPETDYPVLMAHVQRKQDGHKHSSAIRSCADLYCQQDDDVEHTITLPHKWRGVSQLYLQPKSAGAGRHGQLMLTTNMNHQKEHILVRVDVLRQANKHLMLGEEEEDNMW